MPVYTYQCNNCGVRFERLQSFTDKPLTRCPECRKKQLRKVFVPAGIIFKGSGWYSTDHRSSSGRSGKATESADKAPANAKTKAEAADKAVKTDSSESKSTTSEE